jgi:hypothetical protein
MPKVPPCRVLKEEDEATRKKNEAKYNKQLFIIGAVIFVILVVVLVPVIEMTFFSKFEYIGLEFKKINRRGVDYYATNIPVVDENGQIVGVTWSFRNDPRELEYIGIENVKDNTIKFTKTRKVYIVLQKDMPECEDNMPTVVDLTSFLKDFALMKVHSAFNDKEFAEAQGFPYITCENNLFDTAVILKNSNETKITQIKDNCYLLEYKDCEIKKVSERFSLIVLEKYMDLFHRGIRSEEEYLEQFKDEI